MWWSTSPPPRAPGSLWTCRRGWRGTLRQKGQQSAEEQRGRKMGTLIDRVVAPVVTVDANHDNLPLAKFCPFSYQEQEQ